LEGQAILEKKPLFELRNLRLKNNESDAPALIAQRAVAGISGESYHYSLVNFAIVFTSVRIGDDRPRIFHGVTCEVELERLNKKFRYEIRIDLSAGAPGGDIEKTVYSEPLGQVAPGPETATIRLFDGSDLLTSIQAPVSFSGPENLVPPVTLNCDGVWCQ
jgi:hypothetical protein